MARYADTDTPIGTRVRFTVPIDRFPFCEIPEGATGTVTTSRPEPGSLEDSAHIALIVTLDERMPDLDEWDNGVQFFTLEPEEVGTLEII